MKKEYLFSSPLYIIEDILEEKDLNYLEEKFLLDEQKMESTQKSNQGGWQSPDSIRLDFKYQFLFDRIYNIINQQVMPDLCHPGEENHRKVEVSNAWININRKGNWNQLHTHNGSFLAGCVYIKTDEESDLVFVNTHDVWFSGIPSFREYQTAVHFNPKPGDLYLFPSGLMHMVTPNATDNVRISMAFNTNLV